MASPGGNNNDDCCAAQTASQAMRSRSGCLTCRARKVRCDQNELDATTTRTCGRCARLGVQCVSSNNASLSQQERELLEGNSARRNELNQAGFTRLRTAASCRHCRSRRQKCSGERPACARCLQSNRVCVYDKERTSPARRGDTRRKANATTTTTTAAASTPAQQLQPHGTTQSGSATPAATPAPAPVTSKSLRNLQDKATVRALAEAFFREIAPLRCFGFIHEPSFMLHVDYLLSNEDKDPLLLTICALATTTINQGGQIQSQGASWAHSALLMTRNHAYRININTLMCLVLLHEFFTRVDELRQCFILSCLACRLCQGLQLNVEYDEDFECKSSSLSPTEKETRRRLMWACYTIDFHTSGGLDSVKMLREEDITIQMPSEEESFFYRTPATTSFIRAIGQLGQPDEAVLSMISNAGSALGGYRAYYIHLLIFRERVLRYLKRRNQEENPSCPMSEFNLLASDLDQWKSSLPQNLRLNPEIIYIRKSQGVLAALFDLHTSFHQCGCDLYRAMIPELQLPPRRQNNMTVTASAEFLAEGKQKWFQHACDLTSILRLAMEHAPHSMTEPHVANNAYTTIRTKLYYHMYITSDQDRPMQAESVGGLITTDLEYLRQLNKLHPSTARILAASEELVRTLDPRSGGARAAEEASTPADQSSSKNSTSPHSVDGVGEPIQVDLSTPSTTSQSAACRPAEGCNEEQGGHLRRKSQRSVDHILHPLTPLRIIRNQMPEKHVPEKMRSINPALGGTDGLSPEFDLAAPFLMAPAELPQQQFSGAFWDLDETPLDWMNADVPDTGFGLSAGWLS